MSWFRVDDQAAFHPKIVRAGNAAFGAWVRLGAYCNAQLTDGFVSDQVARLIASRKELDAMVSAEMLSAENGGFRIHDYLEYQPSRADVLRQREATNERVKRHRNGVTKAVETPLPSDPDPDPVPSSPDPEIKPLPGKPSALVKRVVDRWRPLAEQILASLSAARKRVRPASRDISPTYDTLAHIADRLEGGASAADCLHVVEVCEAECTANPDAFRWFDAITPFRRDNFTRKCAADLALASATSPAIRARGHAPVSSFAGVQNGVDQAHLLRSKA